MSQFDFPRINFSGSVWLDVGTANNGYHHPLVLFNQKESKAYMPPRLYIESNNQTGLYTAKQAGLTIYDDPDDPTQKYVELELINDNNYQDWAQTPIGGDNGIDADYNAMYSACYKDNFQKGICPGYWDLWGDMSVRNINLKVTGITVPGESGGVVTFIPSNPGACPVEFLPLLTAKVDTQAYLCDLDSIGQLLTQIFWGPTGLSSSTGETLISGMPVKSSTRWMNLKRVINTSNIAPTGGSASFFSYVDLSSGTISDKLSKAMAGYIGEDAIHALFMKINIHQVFEVRNPDYSKLPSQEVKDFYNNSTKRNPAKATFTGSFCPYKAEDMQTGTISRMLKTNNTRPANFSSGLIDLKELPTWPSYSGSISQLIQNDENNTKVPINSSVDLPNIQFLHNSRYNLVSLDLINAINEYGIVTEGTPYPSTSAGGDVKPFSKFENCNFGTFHLQWTQDGGGAPNTIGKFNWENDYNMNQFLANGGMVDLPVDASEDYSKGTFQLVLNGFVGTDDGIVMIEDESWVLSDQSGAYCEQNGISGPYLTQKLPMEKCYLRAFTRGVAIQQQNPVTFYWQNPNNTNPPVVEVQVYDGMQIIYSAPPFNVISAGCFSFGLYSDLNYQYKNTAMNFYGLVSFIAIRVLAHEQGLEKYTNGSEPVTWDAVYENVLREYKTMLPIMDAVHLINKKNWSDTIFLNQLKAMISLDYWQYLRYMPVTRGLTQQQRTLLKFWADQIINQQETEL